MTKTFRDRRIERGWTQQELADRCTAEGAPISESQISKIERRVWKGRPQVRAVLARLLNLDVSWFDHNDEVSA
jgi:transcriptional regulator with XRE-family HTH domain